MLLLIAYGAAALSKWNTTFLDPVTSWDLIQLLIQINSMGTTVLMATHNQEIVNAMRRRVVALENGSVVRDELGAAYERGFEL